jgi:hypothetical protein
VRRAQTVCLAKIFISLVKIVYCTVEKMVVVKIIAFYHNEKIVGLNMCCFWLSIKEEEELLRLSASFCFRIYKTCRAINGELMYT